MTGAPRPPDRPVDLSPGTPAAGLHRWLAEGRIDDAVEARARQRWLERQAAEDATMLGVLVDLAERGRPIAVTTAAARRISGPVVAVGSDFVVLRDARAGDAFVPAARLAIVRAAPGDDLPTGDRPAEIVLALGAALMELAPERPDVAVAVANEDIRGELVSVGADVITVALDGARRDRAHIRLDAIDHLVILDR